MVDLSSLNNEQKEAVLDFDHNLLLLACAGSGKTKTITTKIAYAIENKIYSPYEIVAVTFTNRAAKEMRERVEIVLPDYDISKIQIRTFHSLGAFLLRLFYKEAGLSKNFCIYDDEESISLLATVSSKDKKYLKDVFKDISIAKDKGIRPSDKNVEEYSAFPDFKELYSRYQKALDKTGNVDFGDLIGKTRELIKKKNSEARKYVHSRFKLILVDEYQDSNAEQFEFLKAFKANDAKLVVVGDDDQSIYSFRGAEISNILSFSNKFDNVRSIKIEKNYRSTNEILRASDALIKKNKERHQKTIVSADGKTGNKPIVLRHYNALEEAEDIVLRIQDDRDYEGTAILYRTNAQSALFEKALIEKKIPYKIVGALRFYEREEVKDALAILYLLLNKRDVVSFKRIINKPARGLGDKSVESILSLSENVFDALKMYVDKTNSTGAIKFLTAWMSTEKLLASPDVTLGEMLSSALNDFGFFNYFNSKIKDYQVRETKLDNIYELIGLLEEAGNTEEDLIKFLEELTLDQSVLGHHDPRDDKGVTLITMHNTKGLEFDKVYCVGLEEEIIPGTFFEREEGIEEERRILYVAMTRARKELYLSFADYRSRYGMPSLPVHISPFIRDIPKELLSGYYPGERKKIKDLDILPHQSLVKEKPSFDLSSFAHKIDASTIIDLSKKEEKPIEKALHLEIGDRVRNINYGEGFVEDKVRRDIGGAILVVRFNQKVVRFIEGKAPLEKIEW